MYQSEVGRYNTIYEGGKIIRSEIKYKDFENGLSIYIYIYTIPNKRSS